MVEMGKMVILPTTWMVLVHRMMSSTPSGARRMSPLQECLVGSKMFAEGGGGVLCLSISNNLKVKHTFMAGSKDE